MESKSSDDALRMHRMVCAQFCTWGEALFRLTRPKYTAKGFMETHKVSKQGNNLVPFCSYSQNTNLLYKARVIFSHDIPSTICAKTILGWYPDCAKKVMFSSSASISQPN